MDVKGFVNYENVEHGCYVSSMENKSKRIGFNWKKLIQPICASFFKYECWTDLKSISFVPGFHYDRDSESLSPIKPVKKKTPAKKASKKTVKKTVKK